MKRPLIAVLLMMVGWVVLASPPQDTWKKVRDAMDQGLPRSAIERLEPIIQRALAEKDWPEAIHAIAQKIALYGNIEGNKPEERIVRLKAEIAKAPAPMRPVMEAILANWYWQYFQNNRWRFMQRIATKQTLSDDFTTWDLPRLLAEVDRHFTQALSSASELQKIPIGKYDSLLVKGTMPDRYRPTLYDFLVYDALDFYNAGEQAGAKGEDSFELSADSAIFAAVEEFVAWKPSLADEASAVLKALRLYQDLLRIHQGDEDKSAYLDADLARLVFGHNHAVGEEKSARYKAALKRFVDRWGDHEVSARARYEWGRQLHEEEKWAEAHPILEAGLNAFPESVGGRQCFNLIKQIEAPELNITTERVWCEPWPSIQVRYRNLSKVYFRAVAYDYSQRLSARAWQPESTDDGLRKSLLAARPELAWEAELPATPDYRPRTEDVPAPQKLKPGFYFVLASRDERFGETNNVVQTAPVWVSRLAMVVRTQQGAAEVGGFILEADSGRPIPGAEVRAYGRQGNVWQPLGSGKTDANGLFRIHTGRQQQVILYARHQDQELASHQGYWIYPQDRAARAASRTVFFTDRVLYRPGQTVQYKGICIEGEPSQDTYRAMAGQSLTVVFRDANGKEIARQAHRSNDYGSFSGSFTAPRDRLMGRMQLFVEGGPRGEVGITVEEYKRPKFQVNFEPPKAAPRLDGEVEVKGVATAYTGAAVDGAKVRWRVVREVQYPVWWHWRFWYRAPRSVSQEIAHGTATTGSDGSFLVKFKAKPDRTVAEKDEPIFRFSATADVTDNAGETRSAERTVRVGYTALQAEITADDWQTTDKPISLRIRTTTLDDQGQRAEGSLKVYRLKAPDKVVRSRLSEPYRHWGAEEKPPVDPSDPRSWPLREVVAEEGFTTDAEGKATATVRLTTGLFRVMLTTQDRFGKAVTAEWPLRVLDPSASKFPLRVADVFAAPQWKVEPGGEFTALWGTGYSQGRAFIEIEHRGKLVQSYWTPPAATQATIKLPVTEAHRGGFTVRATMVRENRAYLHSQHVDVPWSNKDLKIGWERFVSKLQPGQKETWTAIITGPDAKRAVAEMVATLYDQSLDAYLRHSWTQKFSIFRQDYSRLSSQFENVLRSWEHLAGQWEVPSKNASCTYREYPPELIGHVWAYAWAEKAGFGRGAGMRALAMAPAAAAPAPASEAVMADAASANGLGRRKAEMKQQVAGENLKTRGDQAQDKGGQTGGKGPDLGQVTARKNLNETAFFFPSLVSSKEGEVRIEFTMPEALTQWRFMGFAHDRELRCGYLEDSAVTAKDLMVQPNPPRFLREGDTLEFAVKVTNQSAARQTGKVRLTFSDARTSKPVDAELKNTAGDQAFDIPSKESRSFSWKLSVPDGMGFLVYKAVGSTGQLSDGEEGFLPVLSRRILVTESLPLPIRGPQTKKFTFEKLLQSGRSDTLKHESLTLQMVSNPAWYAVMALPYLIEFPYECSEQVFNRFYANALARHIANRDPKIRQIFDQWKATPALESPLEKNQDLKAVLLEETPWVRQAAAESQARKNVGILFDENRLNTETAGALKKLVEQQVNDGLWPWFPGGPSSEYITLYITTGFGRLRHLGVDVDVAPAVKSLAGLDRWIVDIYGKIKKKDENHLSCTVALYLYGRSFFLKDRPIPPTSKEAVDYFLGQAKKYWLAMGIRQSQGHLALALKRFGDTETAQAIVRSLKERSVSDEELGMFWRDTEHSWWWYHAPIETQALMIEVFDEVTGDAKAVDDCQVWLLKQKQTQDWKTTKATADAVYALLLRGQNLLASDALVEVSLDDVKIKPEKVEAGTGFYEKRFSGPEIKPAMGEVTVKKVDPGVAWGGLHWQYLEDMSKVTPYAGTPLKLEKRLFTKHASAKGPVLEAVAGPVAVGDELVVRVVLRTDRDMEYVHLKDQRPSGTEPVNVLSRYRYQDGLGYYESTRDTASHFFIDYLPKGTYVFEYSVRVQQRGRYQSGVAEIQCMYAPEFNSHSESVVVEAR